jgi:Uma2 family endonuclease
MEEYIANGTQLAWLIDRFDNKAYIFKEDKSVIKLDSLNVKLSGELVLPGFVLDLESLIK